VPNTGKTKWLKMLNYLLGDSSTFESSFEEELYEKYDSARVELFVGENKRFVVERRWKENGEKSKIFVNSKCMTTSEFQTRLLVHLEIPILNFPKGNPLSGQTWPELSFRMLLRHIHRQQKFWGDLADKQPESEQLACILQFLGLAEEVYTVDYGRLIDSKLKLDKLIARHDQYNEILEKIAGSIITTQGLEGGVNSLSIGLVQSKIDEKFSRLRSERTSILSRSFAEAIEVKDQDHVHSLMEKRIRLIQLQETLNQALTTTKTRVEEMTRYRSTVNNELSRLSRVEDASFILADLKITHCPACDQFLKSHYHDPDNCQLCNQALADEPVVPNLGESRLKFEQDRLTGELEEADSLLRVLSKKEEDVKADSLKIVEVLRMVENELKPSREAVSAFVNEDLSAVDMELGALNERERQVYRLKEALATEVELTLQIDKLKDEIYELEPLVDESSRVVDFDRAEDELSIGMGSYLRALNKYNPMVWRHKVPEVKVSRFGFSIRIGARRWNTVLGGTDTLYFLMSYHYGLLWLSDKPGMHYPGISIIDLPGDFLGESIEDKENFIVRPFIDLLNGESFSGAQVIMTGASFKGLEGVSRHHLNVVYVE
jgi:hypothetical protein